MTAVPVLDFAPANVAPVLTGWASADRTLKGSGPRQPRLITPLAKRLDARRPRGDFLVALRRGLAGKRVEHIEIAAALGLRRWGDQALGMADDDSFTGMAKQIPHLVTSTYLGRVVTMSELRHLGGTLMFLDSGAYQSDAARGYFQALAGDEYIHAERQRDGAQSVMWSTEMDARGFLDVCRALLRDGLRPSAPVSWSTSTEVDVEGTLEDFESLLNQRPDAGEAFDVDLGPLVIFWREAAPKLATDRVIHREAATFVPPNETLSFKKLNEFLRLSGSTAVRATVDGSPETLEAIVQAAL